jgi:hypothetical protein
MNSRFLKVCVVSLAFISCFFEASAQDQEGRTQPPSAQCAQQPHDLKEDNYESWIRVYRIGGWDRDPHHIQLRISVIDKEVDEEASTACDELGGATMKSVSVSTEGTVSSLRISPLAFQRGGPRPLPAKASEEMKILIASLRAQPPEDHSQLPSRGHRVVLQVAKGSKVLARVYDRDNLPTDVLKVFDLTGTHKP